MMEPIPRKRKFNPIRSRLPGLILIILLLYFGVALGFQLNKIGAMQKSIDGMEVRVVELRNDNKDLWNRLNTLESDGYIEDTARDHLGLINPGEVQIVPVAPEDDTQQPVDRSIQD